MKKLLLIFIFFPYFLYSQAPSVFINLAGEECTETDYNYPLSNDVMVFCKHGKYGIKDKTGKELVFDEKYVFGKPMGYGISLLVEAEDRTKYIEYKCKGKLYLFDKKGNMLAGGELDDINTFKNNTLIVFKKMPEGINRAGIIDTLGNWIIKPEYSNLYDLGDPVYYFSKDGKKGFLVKSSKQEILTKYDEIRPFSDGLAAVRSGGKWGYIDYTGKLIIPMRKATYAGFFWDNMVCMLNDNKSTWLDKTGKTVENPGNRGNWPKNEEKVVVYNEVLVVPETGLYSRITGKFLHESHDNYYFLTNDFRSADWSIIVNEKSTENPKPQILFKYNGTIVSLDPTIGFDDTKYNRIKNGVFPVKSSSHSGNIGFIDATGKVIVPFNFIDVLEYGTRGVRGFDEKGLAKVIKDSKENRQLILDEIQKQPKRKTMQELVKESQARERADSIKKADAQAEKMNAISDRLNAGKPCLKCNGTGHLGGGKISCSSCGGSGGSTCSSCGGSRYKYVRSSDGHTSSQNCTSCGGQGKKTCYSCSGRGYSADPSAPVCPDCQGSGHR